jgi:hypothetical protein
VSRALRARAKGNESRMRAALERALELFDLTITDPRFVTERGEVVCASEVVCDFLVGDNDYQTTPGSLEAYFLAFATNARNDRRAQGGAGGVAGDVGGKT